ncbi:hypothetical protein [Salimicrobium album]|uniref:Uncharacterized protein n=1 Tax=Salimicrobium album TaxID=50717 RepID=A0A1H3G417_9BACI|nr:hypothetical protein [Salimicrobium album]SDX97767.1 hypothetical protein SAMN04488081_1786 [Salimicrobium album]
MCGKCERLEVRVRQQEETVAQLIEMIASVNGKMQSLNEKEKGVPGRR